MTQEMAGINSRGTYHLHGEAKNQKVCAIPFGTF